MEGVIHNYYERKHGLTLVLSALQLTQKVDEADRQCKRCRSSTRQHRL
jgi:hypothetical protein